MFVLIIVTLQYIKPIEISTNLIDNYNSNIVLNRNFNRCNVNIVLDYKDDNEIITNDLIKNGYKKIDGKYVINKKLKKSCDNIYKNYEDNKIKFFLNGKKSVVVEALSEYNDEKYTINRHDKNVQAINTVDTKYLGKKYVVYRLNEELYLRYLIREIEVKDTTKPSIELKGKESISIYLNEEYKDPGYIASDNYDGDITDKVTISGSVDTKKTGKYELVYNIKDSSGNETEAKRVVTVKEKEIPKQTSIVSNNKNLVAPSVDSTSNLTYINGILIVNKTYGLPSDYNPGTNQVAYSALTSMQNDARTLGYNLRLVSGFRSYQTQVSVYNNYVNKYGVQLTDTFSARPGHSEHQTGLAFDVGQISNNFGDTPSGKWLADNCHLYGFIIRYPKGKQGITGYKYEPWHIRYLGVDIATKVKESGLTLEEYLGI